ncbi:MAG: ATP-binding cassette domain-containing protein [Dysgonamonadaceae bacterium]|jgi:lipopolysaccharide transport system ATP-binding protein|nr:ATP-binding cassette domain-containing protein [Dysgonamonadaceae bacterium]
MSNIAIQFENISKQYRLGLVSTKTLSHDLNRWWQTAILKREDPYLKIGETNDRSVAGNSEYVWALRDINFDVNQGDVLGIIGKNGAGKSTLLKILSRVTTPTTGIIRARGKIASLLEVGTGFHPELTGRENIYMNGAIMGMTKSEITRKLDEIVEFAGVARYIDTPTKRYSSGMTVRLGFAIAAHLDPEILVVDEVLAVGDAEFQKKAVGKMQEVSRGEGRTVLFVSHQLNSVRALCNKCILMDNGCIADAGDTETIVSKYLNQYNDDSMRSIWINPCNEFYSQYFTPAKMYVIDKKSLLPTTELNNNDAFGVCIEGKVEAKHHGFNVGFAVYSSSGELIFWSLNTDSLPHKFIDVQMGQNKIVMWMQPHYLNEGKYRVELITSIHNNEWLCKPETKSPSIFFNINGGLSDSPFWQEHRPGIMAPINEFEILNI